jgi:hypothetical protein
MFLCYVQIFASDEFLELTEYTREEILGRNCRSAQLDLSIVAGVLNLHLFIVPYLATGVS